MAEAKADFDREQEAIKSVSPKDYLFRILKAV